MISGFLDPQDPLFVDLNIPRYFKQYKKFMGTCLTNIICIEHEDLEVQNLDHMGRGVGATQTNNDNFVGPKQSSISIALHQNGKQDGGTLIAF